MSDSTPYKGQLGQDVKSVIHAIRVLERLKEMGMITCSISVSTKGAALIPLDKKFMRNMPRQEFVEILKVMNKFHPDSIGPISELAEHFKLIGQ